MAHTTEWNESLFRTYHRLNKPYSSYPTVEQFQHNISAFERFSALRTSRQAQRALALNVHIPFSANACYYGTEKNIVTKDRSRSTAYLRSLEQEMRLIAKHVNPEQSIEQLHLGGATPTFLNPSELRQLMGYLKDNFNVDSNNFSQYTIDIDPRETDWSTMGVLRDIGFNRVNIEVQGLAPDVQRAINRLQTIEQTQNIVEAARTLQFRTVSINLIYGLPKQTPFSFTQALTEVLALIPDRVVLQGFQHQPQKYRIQQRINAADLPTAEAIAQMLEQAQQLLNAAGYGYIGMGHFALADDDFASAQEDGTLQHGTQGYSTCRNCDTIGFGVSAISQLGNLYYQNTSDLTQYQTALSNQQLAPARGILCNSDDLIRSRVIHDLSCQFSVNFASLERRYGIHFKDYFKALWPQIERMQNDGLLTISQQALTITAQGRLFTLAVCQLFDRYLTQSNLNAPVITQAI